MSEKKGKAPAGQFYYGDFLTATQGWLDAEVGVYIRLLCVQFDQGSLPDDLERLSIIAPAVRDAWPILEPKFPVCDDDRRRNPRMEQIRLDYEAFRKKQSDRARGRKDDPQPSHGAAAADATGEPRHMPEGVPNRCSPSPSPSLDSNSSKGGAPKRLSKEERIREMERQVHTVFDDEVFMRKMRTSFPRVDMAYQRDLLISKLTTRYGWAQRRKDWRRTVGNWLANAEKWAREKPEAEARAAEIRRVDQGQTAEDRHGAAQQQTRAGSVAGLVGQVASQMGADESPPAGNASH